MAEENQEEAVQVEEEDAPDPDWGDDISPDKDGRLFKNILTAGYSVEHPGLGDEVSVHYTGRLLSGEVFDSSVNRGEMFKFKLGKNQVIKGWDVGVATMCKGEKCILTCKPDYAYGEAGSPPKIPPNATLQFEVELFEWSGDDLTDDGGVVKSILSLGDGYSKPEDGARVEAHIRGTYKGRIIEERDVDFEFGEGSEQGLLPGVEKAIGSMQTNEVASVVIKGEYIYGKLAKDERLPEDAELTYEIRLNKFVKPKQPWEYNTVEERVAEALSFKEKGTKYFKVEKYNLALKLYTRGAELLADTQIDQVTDEAKQTRIVLHLNLAAVHLKLDESTLAIKECQDVLDDDDKNVKAHFRKGQAHLHLQDYDEAISEFHEVLKIEPGNKAARKQIEVCRSKQKSQRDREKRLYSAMFQKMAQEEDKEDKEEKEEKQPDEPTPAATEEVEPIDTKPAPESTAES